MFGRVTIEIDIPEKTIVNQREAEVNDGFQRV